MKGWFWSSAFGPLPSSPTGSVRTNGSPGHTITAKKKAVPSARAAPAQGMSALARSRNRCRTSAAQPVASSVQNRIEPSSAAHSEMTE
jgi:hypothetical protein